MKLLIKRPVDLDIDVILFNINKLEDLLYGGVLGFYDDIKVPENIKMRFEFTLKQIEQEQQNQPSNDKSNDTSTVNNQSNTDTKVTYSTL